MQASGACDRGSIPRGSINLAGSGRQVAPTSVEIEPAKAEDGTINRMNKNRVIHFEVQATDPECSATFYRDVFGWEIQEWVIPGVEMKNENRYWLVTTGPDTEPGINGGILFRRGPAPAETQGVNAFVCTIAVSSIDEYVGKVTKAGGVIALSKMAILGVGWLAYCKDIDGNIFGMMQDDKSAQ